MAGHHDRGVVRPESLGVERLTSFLAVVDHGGFSAAAIALPRSQSRVSVHVAELEDILGAPLIDRASRPVVPTDIGNVLAEYVRRSLDELRVGAEHVRALLNLEQGEVRIGSYGSASISFLPSVIRSFTLKHPGVHVALHESSAQEADRALFERRVSLAIRTRHPPVRTDGIRSRTLWTERMVLVLPDGARGPASAKLADVRRFVRQHSVISVGVPPERNQHDPSQELDTVRLVRQLGADSARALYTLHPQALISMVRSGLGIGVVNELAVRASESSGVVTIPLEVPDAEREVVLCWYEGHYHSAAERRMFEEIVGAAVPDGAIAAAAPSGPAAESSPRGVPLQRE